MFVISCLFGCVGLATVPATRLSPRLPDLRRKERGGGARVLSVIYFNIIVYTTVYTNTNVTLDNVISCNTNNTVILYINIL